MRIAVLYIAEAYQIYHNASVAFELAKRGGCTVEIFYSDPETPAHVEHIRRAWGGPALAMHRLARGPLVRAVQSLRMFGFWKEQVMRENAAALNAFDAVICTEATDTYLRDVGLTKPFLVFVPHGAGDRQVGYLPEIARFDFVTPPGEKCAARMRDENLIREGHYSVPGYIKFEVAERLASKRAPLFANNRPIVLFNPHRAPSLSAWPRFVEPIIDYFQAQDCYNLVIAPHVKMFHRMPDVIAEKWRRRSTDTVLIDTGSWASLDMTYTLAAEIYMGDVSSQVYEFLATPKPCIFLNAHKADWRNDPNYAHWHLGDVIEEPDQLPAAIAAAPEHHLNYVGAQREKVALALGDISPGATRRAADAIYDFVHRARP
jgi:hypothetical protein